MSPSAIAAIVTTRAAAGRRVTRWGTRAASWTRVSAGKPATDDPVSTSREALLRADRALAEERAPDANQRGALVDGDPPVLRRAHRELP